MWNDEAETAMYAERILKFGYPKVHDGDRIVYELAIPLADAVKEPYDAYLGSPWGQYYFATIGAWFAATVDDPYAKTLWLRLPFAIAGALGVALLAILIIALLEPRQSLGCGAAAVFLLLASLSISLIEHLREVRYYSVAMLLVVASLVVRLLLLDPTSPRWTVLRAVLLAALLGMLANLFYPAFLGVGVALGIDALLRARAAPAGSRWGTLARGGLPLALSALIVIPSLAMFETLRVVPLIAGKVNSKQPVATLLGVLLIFFRYDFLLPATIARVLLTYWRGRVPRDSRAAALKRRIEASDLLLMTMAFEVLAVSRVPLLYERYLVPVSPLVAAILVLDAVSVIDLCRTTAADSVFRRRRRAAVAAIALGIAVVLPWRAVEVADRVSEIIQPYRGPLDLAIERIRARYPDPGRLVIATNYESTVFMYYLRSRVVGQYGNYGADPGLESPPDVIIRRPWPLTEANLPRFLPILRAVREGLYQGELLPVANLPYNNTPELSIGPGLGVTHQFRSVAPSARYPALVLLHRLDAAPETR